MKKNVIKNLFLVWLVSIVGCLCYVWNIAREQEKKIWEDYDKMQIAKAKMAKSQSRKEAAKILSEVLLKYPESFWLHFLYGTLIMVDGDLPKAEYHLRKAREINIFIVFNPSYLAKASECYMKLHKWHEAEQYAVRIKKITKKLEHLETSENLLKAIFSRRKKNLDRG